MKRPMKSVDVRETVVVEMVQFRQDSAHIYFRDSSPDTYPGSLEGVRMTEPEAIEFLKLYPIGSYVRLKRTSEIEHYSM